MTIDADAHVIDKILCANPARLYGLSPDGA